MGITTVTRNYQITLPSDIRQLQKIKIGDKFIVSAENGEIIMKKLKGELLESSFGAWKAGGLGVEYVRKIRDEAEKRENDLGL